MSFPYIIFVGKSPDVLEPFEAAPDQNSAINRALQLQDTYSCVEVSLMPEDNLDVNELVYSYYK